MTEPTPLSAEELERLGDEALGAGDLERAHDRYDQLHRLLLIELESTLLEVSDREQISGLTESLARIGEKRTDVRRALAPPKPLDEVAAEFQAARDESIASGDIIDASGICMNLGAVLEQLGDGEGAESAYRQAVVLARQVDAAMPELMLAAFHALIDFLPPSEESVALAQEMATNLIGRDEMYHPMRAAEAAYHCAVAELRFAAVASHRVDHVVKVVARQAIAILDDVCLHGGGQDLQRQAAELLRGVGRHSEADQWQAEADRYEDWSLFMDQEIPGHVHLWDIRIDQSTRREKVSDHSDQSD